MQRAHMNYFKSDASFKEMLSPLIIIRKYLLRFVNLPVRDCRMEV
ncbi:Hypothetical Protein XCAW_02840 [Xanthomonas citri subsp. citri Aw12879]|nr:Hypothetical Protein XCAW_02840 [Xanthomonas citri subsp. citri Aw12879]CEE23106.1 hypothetical protein XAC1083_230032 [Xanthomonas citri pv. citri]CEF35908.1 hypothetical protein XAC40_260033 [Xanthomonas citri pv. citri]CEF44567.1 hypothetical protein XAC217_270033 [Xanthomonas citri pv. citri]CEH45085.1 hypothetical protein XACLG97_3300010 [Xanthomonas citri pv. citri]